MSQGVLLASPRVFAVLAGIVGAYPASADPTKSIRKKTPDGTLGRPIVSA